MTGPRALADAMALRDASAGPAMFVQAEVKAANAHQVTVVVPGSDEQQTWPSLAMPIPDAGDVVWLTGPPGSWVCVGTVSGIRSGEFRGLDAQSADVAGEVTAETATVSGVVSAADVQTQTLTASGLINAGQVAVVGNVAADTVTAAGEITGAVVTVTANAVRADPSRDGSLSWAGDGTLIVGTRSAAARKGIRVSTVDATGAISGASLAVTTVTASGTVNASTLLVGSVNASGTVDAGRLQGNSAGVSGQVSAGSFSGGSIQVSGAAGCNTLDCNSVVASGTVDAGRLQGNTAGISGLLGAGSISAGGNISASGELRGGTLDVGGRCDTGAIVASNDITTAGAFYGTSLELSGNVLFCAPGRGGAIRWNGSGDTMAMSRGGASYRDMIAQTFIPMAPSWRSVKRDLRDVTEYLGQSPVEAITDMDIRAWRYDPDRAPEGCNPDRDHLGPMLDDINPRLIQQQPDDPDGKWATWSRDDTLGVALAAIAQQAGQIAELQRQVADLQAGKGHDGG